MQVLSINKTPYSNKNVAFGHSACPYKRNAYDNKVDFTDEQKKKPEFWGKVMLVGLFMAALALVKKPVKVITDVVKKQKGKIKVSVFKSKIKIEEILPDGTKLEPIIASIKKGKIVEDGLGKETLERLSKIFTGFEDVPKGSAKSLKASNKFSLKGADANLEIVLKKDGTPITFEEGSPFAGLAKIMQSIYGPAGKVFNA